MYQYNILCVILNLDCDGQKSEVFVVNYPNEYTCWKFQCGGCVQLNNQEPFSVLHRYNLFAFFDVDIFFCSLMELDSDVNHVT